MVVVGETAQHFDLCWTDPYIYEVYERGVSFSRTVYMQPRGFGLSERIRYVPTLEQHADDILAVMDAVGMRTATLVGVLTTSGLTALAAARAPERVANLVLFKRSRVAHSLQMPSGTDGRPLTSPSTCRAGSRPWIDGAAVR